MVSGDPIVTSHFLGLLQYFLSLRTICFKMSEKEAGANIECDYLPSFLAFSFTSEGGRDETLRPNYNLYV